MMPIPVKETRPLFNRPLFRSLSKWVLFLMGMLLAIAMPILIGSCTSLLAGNSSHAETLAETVTSAWVEHLPEVTGSESWTLRSQGRWGDRNLEVMSNTEGRFPAILRVHYPAGSASPTVSRQTGAPIGGAQFYATSDISPQESLRLSYDVRFPGGFNFVRGGKLPGLFGGTGNNGRTIPTGTDGFSTRYMWRQNGAGEIYAYLPTSEEHGTSIGRGNWRFQPGRWHHLTQEVILNQPDRPNGSLRVWVDDRLVLEQSNLTFRTIDSLKLEGILFSTFFGGGDPSWATPVDTYIDFANFSIEIPPSEAEDA